MNVWLDDERPMPFGYDIHVKTAQAAIKLLSNGNVELISLDHDLGLNSGTGYDVAKWIEQSAFEGKLPKLQVKVHSQNPVGKTNINLALQNAMKYWTRVST